MNRVTYYLKKEQSKKRGIIYLDFSYNGYRLQASTGVKIDESEWSKEKGYLKRQTMFYSHNHEILQRAGGLAERYYLESIAKNNTIPLPSVFRAYLKDNIVPKTPIDILSPQSEFIKHSNEYIESNSAKLKMRSIGIYKQAVAELSEFCETTGIPLTFDTINLSLWDKYHSYLLTKENTNSNCKTKVGYLNDTIAKRASNIKTFMKWSFERNYHSNLEYLKIKVRRSTKNEIVTLTKKEISKIIAVDLSKSPHLKKVRDLFLFGIATCQRWSDIENFNTNDLKDNTWTFRAVKTNKLTIIPFGNKGSFTYKAFEILTKYDLALPKMSGQAFNRSLKELGEIAGINEEVVISRMQGNKAIEFRKPKYQYMASHMARRTGVTNLMEEGVPAAIVMKLTGHSSYATLMKYLNTSHEATINAMNSVKFAE